MRLLLSKITSHWKITLSVISILSALLRLGFWQLDRAEEKAQRLLFYQQQQALPATTITSLPDQQQVDYRNITVTGYFDSQRYWLLDNSSRQGKYGYEVIMPLRIDSDEVSAMVLVNRGWLLASPLRSELPVIDTPTAAVTLNGYLYPLPANAIFQQSQSDLSVDWPKRILHLTVDSVKQSLNAEVYPLLLRISDDSPGALLTEWQIIHSGPEKHRGYAVQWFAMALALVILYLWFLFRET